MKLLGYVWLIALGWLALPTITAAPNPFEGATGLTAPTPIDELVLSRLQRLEIAPANLCSDAVFCRRVFLDVIGTLPTAQEARGFLDDKTPGKRSRLIDQLLERDEFADYWAMKWCDLLRVKAEFPVNLWPNAVQSYHHWIRSCLKDNLPYDQFVRLLLTATAARLATRAVALDVTEEAVSWIAQHGYEPEYGARPLRRLIQREVEDRIGCEDHAQYHAL